MRDDDDLDLDDDDTDDILKDGESRKISVMFLDSTQRAIADGWDAAAHRPGWRMPHISDSGDARDDAEKEARGAHRDYVRWLQDAHKTPVVVDADAKPKPRRPTSLADSQQAASDAHAEYCAWLRDAHKQQQPSRRKLPWGWAFGDSVG